MSTNGTYYVYILASGRHGTLYIGVTNNVPKRLQQHRSGKGSGFVKKYGTASSTWKHSHHRGKPSHARNG